MRVDVIEMELAARRQRAQAIAELIATAFAWLVSRKPQATRTATA